MSDEAHLDRYYLHRDLTRREPWHGLRPDEEAMLHEEGPPEQELRADVHEALFTYFFAGGAGDWKAVALRAIAVIRRWAPSILSGRSVPPEVIQAIHHYYRPGAGEHTRFHLSGLVDLVGEEGYVVERLMEFFFPDSAEWLKEGCRRLYLVARAYQPALLAGPEGREPSYEDLARIFGELDGLHPDEAARARSRWSARAGLVLRKPIAASGARVPALFGKSATVREKYRAAQIGNHNRRGK